MFLALASTHKTRASFLQQKTARSCVLQHPPIGDGKMREIWPPPPAHIPPSGTAFTEGLVFKMKGSITILCEDVCFFNIFADDKNIEVYLLLLCTKTN